MLVALGQLGLFGAALTAVVIVLLPGDVDAPLWSLVVYTLVGPTYLAATTARGASARRDWKGRLVTTSRTSVWSP